MSTITSLLDFDWKQRATRLARALREAGLDAYFATRTGLIMYVAGTLSPWRNGLIITADGDLTALFWTPDSERMIGEGRIPREHTRSWGDGKPGLMQAAADLLIEKGLSAARIGVDTGAPFSQRLPQGLLTAGEYLDLKKLLPKVQWDNATEIVDGVMSIKEPLEVEYLEKAVGMTDAGIDAALNALRAGVTENEVMGHAVLAMRKAGSSWEWAVTGGVEAGFGDRAMFEGGISQPATNRRLANGDSVIIDLHGTHVVYFSDLSVNALYGTVSPEMRRLADTWESTVDVYLSLVRPGVPVAEVSTKLLEHAQGLPYGDRMLAMFGHGLGTDARQPPFIGPGSFDVFRENQVFAAGVHLYIPGIGGMRLEYPLAVTADGCRPLARTQPRLVTVQ